MQLSPPFQLPQPVGAMARPSDGIEIGIIGGSELGETAPVTVLGEVVVEACGTLVLVLVDVDVRMLVAVVVEACGTLVVTDVDVETCVVLEAAVVEVAAEVI